ncbi:MAG: 2-C-methyl-D-erythritol 2,4-cyclodiphosphate synthase, partial [Chloroflexi bacterium]
MRIGFGYDVHAFTTDRPLVLGGILVPFEFGLSGHSDADAVIHA